MHILKHKHYFNFKRLFTLAIAAYFLLLSMLITFPVSVYANDPLPFTLYYGEDAAQSLSTAALDGGIGEGDTRGALGKTHLITKGGRLGTQRLSLNAAKSDKHDLPVYSLQYYCTLRTDTQDLREPTLSTKKPPASHEYVTLTMGVAIGDKKNWSKLTVDKNYPTRVGLVNFVGSSDSGERAGTWHKPANTRGDDPSKWTQGVDTWVSAGGEKNGIYTSLDKVGPNGDSAPNIIKDCLPNPSGDIGNKTSNYQKLSAADKQDWDKVSKEGNLGENVASASSTADVTNPNDKVDCDLKLKSPLSWIACPLIDMGVGFTDYAFDNFIQPMLEQVPVSTNPEDGVYKAWTQFRFIANLLLIVSLLAIVYSQAKGSK